MSNNHFDVLSSRVIKVSDTQLDEIRLSVPETGFGTVAVPEKDEDSYILSMTWLFSGFFTWYTWLLGIYFITSKRPLSKVGGILSLAFFCVFLIIITALILHGKL
eukprot:TRINITY_DN4457_c0_g1_i1.p1 TRINITY_DN4457_c0_g1~~TRINITY_DN4457_c0_g1_i1.p1  ORF type:complete len:105 (+),score=7.87 TRINITY_DN4457_c0_g1_i1:606-920(+)